MMNSKLETTTLTNLINMADSYANISNDYVTDGKLIFDIDEENTPIINFKDADSEDSKTFLLRDSAIGQMCEKLRIPAPYMRRCINEFPELAVHNINSWLDEYTDPFFVRVTGDGVKAMLSTKYSPYDSNLVLRDIADVLGGNDDYKISGSYLTDERLHVRFVRRDPLNIEGEDLFPGIIIDSSDIGTSSLTAQVFIYKQVCTNGLMLPQSNFGGGVYRRNHVGISLEDFRHRLVTAVDSVNPLIANVEESIIATKNTDVGFDMYNEDEASEILRRRMDISKKEAGRIVEMYNTGRYERNRWGLINSITEVAQEYSIDRRIELENYAGKLLIAA